MTTARPLHLTGAESRMDGYGPEQEAATEALRHHWLVAALEDPQGGRCWRRRPGGLPRGSRSCQGSERRGCCQGMPSRRLPVTETRDQSTPNLTLRGTRDLDTIPGKPRSRVRLR